MNLYSLALFLHVVGALGFFIALGLEWVNLRQLQRAATVEMVNEWQRVADSTRGLAGISMVIILIAGLYMTFAAWGCAEWIEVAFAAMLVQGAVAGILTTPRSRAIRKATEGASGSISSTLDALLNHPMLQVSMYVRVGLALGIVFLMTVKPALLGSLIVMAVAVVLGLAVAMVTMGNRRGQTVVA